MKVTSISPSINSAPFQAFSPLPLTLKQSEISNMKAHNKCKANEVIFLSRLMLLTKGF